MEWAYTYGIHHWQILWSSYRKLAWVEVVPTITELCWDALSDWATSSWVQFSLRAYFVDNSNYIVCSVSHFDSTVCFRQSPCLLSSKLSVGNHICAAEWSPIYGIHHWKILWISSRKLSWVRFEPTPTEFRSDALTHWPITPRVQLAFTVNFVHVLQFNPLFNAIFEFGCFSVSKFILIKIFYR